MNISIRKITEDDWPDFARIRLAALKADPQVFGSNYEKESANTEADWRKPLGSDAAAIFLIYENETPVGMTAASVDRNDPTGKTVILWGSWLKGEFRGKGLSKLMYRARIDWAKAQPTVERIIVSHRASNAASKRANQKHGFRFTHKKEKIWTDGRVEDEMFYELYLVPE